MSSRDFSFRIVALCILFASTTLIGCGTMRANELLFSAAQTGNVNDAKRALQDGGDPLTKSDFDDKTTPLEMAQSNGYREVVRLMKQKMASHR